MVDNLSAFLAFEYQAVNGARLRPDVAPAQVFSRILRMFREDRDGDGFIGTPFAFTFEDETLTTAIFGELEWALREDVRATLGLRYERE